MRPAGDGALDVALPQSLVRKGVVDNRVGDYGHLVVVDRAKVLAEMTAMGLIQGGRQLTNLRRIHKFGFCDFVPARQ